MPLPIVHHPAYVATLPANHRFPMNKFGALAEVLRELGLEPKGGFYTPRPAPRGWLTLAHEPAYVDAVMAAQVPAGVAREIGFPVDETVALRARCATAGTVLTAELALEAGLACNTAGGSHHARRAQGAGFCVFNDVAVAARVMQADGRARHILVIDLDVHQGDGTAEIFAGDRTVFTFSVHGARNYPVRKIASDRDIALPDGMGDTDYLDTLRAVLPALLDKTSPDLVFYNAGVDPHADDRLGRLALSDDGLFERDLYVLSEVRQRGIPAACVIGGGYGEDVTVLAHRHATLHRAAARLI